MVVVRVVRTWGIQRVVAKEYADAAPVGVRGEELAKNDSSIKERCGIQRSFFGDTVVDDYLGQGRGLALHLPLNGDRTFFVVGIFLGTKVDQLNMDMLARQLE